MWVGVGGTGVSVGVSVGSGVIVAVGAGTGVAGVDVAITKGASVGVTVGVGLLVGVSAGSGTGAAVSLTTFTATEGVSVGVTVGVGLLVEVSAGLGTGAAVSLTTCAFTEGASVGVTAGVGTAATSGERATVGGSVRAAGAVGVLDGAEVTVTVTEDPVVQPTATNAAIMATRAATPADPTFDPLGAKAFSPTHQDIQREYTPSLRPLHRRSPEDCPLGLSGRISTWTGGNVIAP